MDTRGRGHWISPDSFNFWAIMDILNTHQKVIILPPMTLKIKCCRTQKMKNWSLASIPNFFFINTYHFMSYDLPSDSRTRKPSHREVPLIEGNLRLCFKDDRRINRTRTGAQCPPPCPPPFGRNRVKPFEQKIFSLSISWPIIFLFETPLIRHFVKCKEKQKRSWLLIYF